MTIKRRTRERVLAAIRAYGPTHVHDFGLAKGSSLRMIVRYSRLWGKRKDSDEVVWKSCSRSPQSAPPPRPTPRTSLALPSWCFRSSQETHTYARCRTLRSYRKRASDRLSTQSRALRLYNRRAFGSQCSLGVPPKRADQPYQNSLPSNHTRTATTEFHGSRVM